MPPRQSRPPSRSPSAALAAAVSLAVAALACHGDSPTGPRDVVIPEGAVFTATVDRTEIVRGDTATITFRLTNPGDTPITIRVGPPSCRLRAIALDARGRDVPGASNACVAPGGDIVIAPHESFTALAPFTGRETRSDGSVFEYPAGRYELSGVVTHVSYDPYERLPVSPRVRVTVRDR